MYQVSDAYKLAVADSHRKSKMRAVLTTSEAVINLNDNDIIKDSVYVTNQCTNGNEYEYGCVYAGECGIAIKSAVDRYSLYDAQLKLYWSLWTGEEWEEIPLGVYYISEPNRVNDKISIKALDCMTNLDINVEEDTQGTFPELAYYVADKCGVELAQTKEELATFINADYLLSVYEDTIESYRDVIACMCMITASFATINRYGKLEFVRYATEPCAELGKKQRFTNATFSDYVTKFVGIKCRFISEENYAPYEAGETGNGLILDMGDIPILRGLPETKHAVLNNVFDVLKDVRYTPFELETMGNPAYDLGDLIVNKFVGKDGKTYTSPITYSHWTYRKKHKLRAVGGNPKLAGVKNKQGKQISSLESEISTKTVIIKQFRNSDVISFSDNEVEIATINYAATENSEPIILLSVRLNIDRDGVLVIQFYTDGAVDNLRTYRKYLERGEHFVTINDIYNVENNDRHTISIKARMEYFESDSRKQQAEITTNNNFLNALKETGATVSDNIVSFPAYDVGVIDTTIATATIKKNEALAILYGQGIAGEGKWDGTINFAENIKQQIKFVGNLRFNDKDFVEKIITATQTPTGSILSEAVDKISFRGNFGFKTNIIAYPAIGEVIEDYTFETAKAPLYTYDKYITTANTMFSLKTIYNYESVEETIDSGKMCSVAIDYTGLTVESVVVIDG